MKRICLLFLLTLSVVALNACSSSNASSGQTVYAQTTYSSASLNGTYSVEISGYPGELILSSGSDDWAGIGTLQLNGSGTVTGGTVNIYVGGAAAPCVESVTGTYAIQSTAQGTATLNLSSTTVGCRPTVSIPLVLAAADGGSSVMMVATDGNVVRGAAAKQ